MRYRDQVRMSVRLVRARSSSGQARPSKAGEQATEETMTDAVALPTTRTGWSEASCAPRLGWVLVLTSAAFFMTCLDTLVVATALPRIQESLHVGFASLQWTVNAYNIALAAGVICAAALGDRYGRRRFFVLGLALFTVASAACAVAPTAALLIGARTAQGLGGAIILPLSLTILTEAYPAERRAAVFGIYGGLAGLAVALGPIVGGAVTQGLDWHWIFWINVPIGIAAGVLSMRLLPETFGPRTPLDLGGVALITVALVGIVWGLVRGNDAGWTSAEIVSAFVVGVTALAGFVVWEARTEHPMLSLRLLRIPAFAAGNAAAFFAMASISAGAFLTTQYFQFGLGYSPLQTGLRLLPFFGTPMVVAPLAGKFAGRLGLRPVIVAGLALLGAGFAAVAFAATLHPSYVVLVVALFAAGVGVSMTIPTVPAAVFGAVDPEQMGTASGTNTMVQRFGAVFGVAIASAVFSANGHLGNSTTFTDGFRPAVMVAAVLALLGALAGFAVSTRTTQEPAAEPNQPTQHAATRAAA
jgi:EmrB/QacA subfamily drug resistance transporter